MFPGKKVQILSVFLYFYNLLFQKNKSGDTFSGRTQNLCVAEYIKKRKKLQEKWAK